MQLAEHTATTPFEEALPDVLMRVVSELHDVAYLIAVSYTHLTLPTNREV